MKMMDMHLHISRCCHFIAIIIKYKRTLMNIAITNVIT